jgi:hypothetical protein
MGAGFQLSFIVAGLLRRHCVSLAVLCNPLTCVARYRTSSAQGTLKGFAYGRADSNGLDLAAHGTVGDLPVGTADEDQGSHVREMVRSDHKRSDLNSNGLREQGCLMGRRSKSPNHCWVRGERTSTASNQAELGRYEKLKT